MPNPGRTSSSALPVPGDVPGTRGGPKGDRGRVRGIAIVVVAVVAVAVIPGLLWWFVWRAPASSAVSRSAESKDSSESSSATSTDSSTTRSCASAPDAQLGDVNSKGSTLVVQLEMTSKCRDDDEDFDQDDVSVTIADSDGVVIADAVYDFSSSPVSFGGGIATVPLAFADSQYWRPCDQIEATTAKVTLQTRQDGKGRAFDSVGNALGGRSVGDADGERHARKALDWQVDHDSERVGGMTDETTTQLSSKRYGMQADNKTWSYRDIYQQFLRLQARHSNALLLWAANWSVYTDGGNASDYYVILSGETFASDDDAKAWRTKNGYSTDDCIPQTLS